MTAVYVLAGLAVRVAFMGYQVALAVMDIVGGGLRGDIGLGSHMTETKRGVTEP